MDPIHEDEVDTSEQVVRSLLASQCPPWADRPLTPLANTGTSNALWRIHAAHGPDSIVRLPRTPGAEPPILVEHQLLPPLALSPLSRSLELPALVHAGQPDNSFPLHWAVLAWIEGEDAWTARHKLQRSEEALAHQLAETVQLVGSLTDLPAPQRQPGDRGGPLVPLIDRLHRWLEDPLWSADDLIDTNAVRRCVDQSAEAAHETPTQAFVHGDLIPGNVLTNHGQLSAIIDWGTAGYGDSAQDLTPAWSILSDRTRRDFQAAVGANDPTWFRGKLLALEQAVGGVLYYVPRKHPLGDVMTRTLSRILTDS
ncbi:MAG: phosphotransferase [bacterium]|nr:phosphotransferase [bacterium]